jgi:membrane protein implicated in regulation of membrane protease activity
LPKDFFPAGPGPTALSEGRELPVLATPMTAGQRIVLLLLAFPFSALLAVSVYWTLDLPAWYGLSIAALIFIAVELLLQRLASRIPPQVGPESLPGQEVEVLSDFQRGEHGFYAGHVRLRGERWRARAAGPQEHVPRPGSKARIERVEGVTLWVSSTLHPADKRKR